MDNINSERNKIMNIYNKISNNILFKKANMRNKLLFFILPTITLIIPCILYISGNVINNRILTIISPLLLILSFLYNNKVYKFYIRKEYKINNKDIYYRFFINNLRLHRIQNRKIKYYIDLFELKEPPYNFGIGFSEYLLSVFIPGMMIYTNNFFQREEAVVYLFLGLFFVPIIIFLIKSITNRNKIKHEIILQYLKRRNIELTVYK